MAPRDLTPQKIRFMKYLHEHGGSARPGEIAAHFNVRTATVTRALHELKDSGFLTHDPYHDAVLTDTGKDMARYLHRRHRILSLMFNRSGLTEKEACSQAEMIEHLVSRDHVNRICHSFGHPRLSSCGRIDHDPGCCEGGVV